MGLGTPVGTVQQSTIRITAPMEPSSSGERRGRGTRPGVRQRPPTNGPPPRPRRASTSDFALWVQPSTHRVRSPKGLRKHTAQNTFNVPNAYRMLESRNNHSKPPCSFKRIESVQHGCCQSMQATVPVLRRHPRIDATPVSVVPGRRTTGPHTAPLLHSTPLSLQLPAHDIPVDSSRAGRRSHRRVAFKRADRRGPTGHQCWRRGLAPRCRARWSHSLCRCIRFGARGRGRGDGVSPHNTSRRTVRLSSSTCR